MLLFLIFVVGGLGLFTSEVDINIGTNNVVHFSGTYGYKGFGKVPVMMYLPEGAESVSVLINGEPSRYLPFGKSGIRFFLTVEGYNEFNVRYIIDCPQKQFSYQLAPFKRFSGEVEFMKIDITYPSTEELQSSLPPEEVVQYDHQTRVCILLEDFKPRFPLQLGWERKD